MKIVATVIDTYPVCVGSHPEARSAIINIPDNLLPSLLLEYLASKKREKESRGSNTVVWAYKDLSFSILEEDS